MPNPFFRFRQFTINHDRCAMKVTTDACLFGAWVASEVAGMQAADDLRQLSPQRSLLDIGAGTGLLSLMVAQKNDVFIDAIEIDGSAAVQAAENISLSPWKSRINVIENDLLQWKPNRLYNLIFSNPPFYQNELKSANSAKNKAHHDEGLQLADLVRFIRTHLTEDGNFFLLLPAKRQTEIEQLLQKAGLFLQQKVMVHQTPKHSPFRVMIRGLRKKCNAEPVQTIIIKDENNQYTPAFAALLKDYYLQL